MQPLRLCICSGRQFEETFEKGYKWNKCDFASAQVDNLRGQLKKKRMNATICDFPSIQAGDFRKHLKIPLGEKAYKCDFASLRADNLRRHLKKHTNATNATLHLYR